MGKKTSKTSVLAAFILVTINLITMTYFVVLFAVSIWVISSPQTLSAAVQSINSPVIKGLLSEETLTVQLGLGLAAVSAFFIFLSFMGLYGAISRSPFLMFIYAILILLLLLLECSLLYYFASGLLEKGLQTQDGQWIHALRLIFKCCEYNATTFDPVVQKSLPWSCCGVDGYPDNCTIAILYTKGCHQTISHWIYKYQTVIYTSLAVLHIILASCSLLRRSRSSPSISYS